MAGSYNHVITEDGNLRSPEMVNRMLENGGDVFEAIEENYARGLEIAKQTKKRKHGPHERQS
jgi:hypothetical protein